MLLQQFSPHSAVRIQGRCEACGLKVTAALEDDTFQRINNVQVPLPGGRLPTLPHSNKTIGARIGEYKLYFKTVNYFVGVKSFHLTFIISAILNITFLETQNAIKSLKANGMLKNDLYLWI